jgi:hypothetical protein
MAVVRPIKSAGGSSYVEEKALGDPAIQAAEVDADFDTIYSAVNAIPAGPGTLAYQHVQATAATTWTITHNLSFRPNVTAVDSTGRAIVPGAVDYPSATAVTLTFSAAVGGAAYLS